jgi:adenylylsulfate kinase
VLNEQPEFFAAQVMYQEPFTVWLTGLSGSGKSTLAFELERRLVARNYHCYVLDGDNVRQGLNRDLGFSPADRTENIRRIAEVARLFNDAGMIVIAAFISPYAIDRARARMIIRPDRFLETWLTADVAACEARDPKGLYAKARSGDIREFTGVSAPYEVPENPALVLDTALRGIDDCVEDMMRMLEPRLLGA